jgi:hypothetical protein
MARELQGLEPGEHLVASTRASFRGAAMASSQAMFALGSGRARQKAYQAWRVDVEALGFPTAGPEMAIALTQTRMLICRTTFWLGRPATIEGSIPLDRIADVGTARHGLVTVLTIALTNGQIVDFEAMRGAPLRRFATALREALPRR